MYMYSDELDKRMAVYDFARRSFRDVADHDYVLARVAFRRGLDVQFLYLGHQAVEKYLKAILVFNFVSTKSLKHDLPAALNKVRTCLPFRVKIPDDVAEFVARLSAFTSRYFEYSYGVSGRRLNALDKAVWHIRRYCADWNCVERHEDGTFTETLNIPLDRIHAADYKKEPFRFRLPFGVLEDLLADGSSELRSELVWNNRYFWDGAAAPVHHLRGASANPTLTLHPEAFEELDKLVHFSGEFRNHFQPKPKKRRTRTAPN
jgi:HEPN domain-containing protein